MALDGQTLAVQVVTGLVASYTVVKMSVAAWVKKVEASLEQIDSNTTSIANHEVRLARAEQDVVDIRETVRSIEQTVNKMAADVAYLRGRAEAAKSE